MSRPSPRSWDCPFRGWRAIALLITKRSWSFDCGKSAMSAAPASNARRRKPFGDAVERTMIGSSGEQPVDAVDDLERPVVLAALAGDENDVGLPVLERPERLVDALGHRHERERRVVRQRPLDVEGVEPFDGDDCADGAFHWGLSPSLDQGEECRRS